MGIEIISLSVLQTVQGGLRIICKFLRSDRDEVKQLFSDKNGQAAVVAD